MKRYNPKELEPKWQKSWSDSKIYRATDFDESRQKFVMLTEFPYPSGDGLHLGHTREYTLGDIIARHHRMLGQNVLYPMGYDAFGLPTENYAIKNKVAPQDATDTNVANFQKQFESLGFSFDWDRSFRTTDPSYYKWTQWLFLQFYKHGLAYQDDIAINWCPFCKTGLANEEVQNGRHERCDIIVEKKQLKQWLLKITAYADRLIDGLNDVDYPSRIADQQINWIGRSKGAEVNFALEATEPSLVSYIMGVDDIRAELEALHPIKLEITEGGNFQVQLPVDAVEAFDKLIAGKLKPGFWNEYAINGEYQFLFKEESGEISRFAWKHGQEEAELLQKRKAFAKADFTSIASMLAGNDWYAAHAAEQQPITVFTTRADTLFGATFLVLAPEHSLVSQITTKEQRGAVNTYILAASAKSDIERQDDSREKTGVFTGAYAINPVNGDRVPIWIADYVLAGYGTGAIMAVPAHDERDHAFAKKYQLPIKRVINPKKVRDDAKNHTEFVQKQKIVAVVENDNGDILTLDWGAERGGRLAIGGTVEGDESAETTALREVTEETGYNDLEIIEVGDETYYYRYFAFSKNEAHEVESTFVHIRLRSDRKVSQSLDDSEVGSFKVEWVSRDKAIADITEPLHRYGIEKFILKQSYCAEGVMTNSGDYNGMASSEAREQIVADLEKKGLGKEKTQYRLRDWIFSRQHYWGEPIPIIHCDIHGAVAVPDSHLPVELPTVEHYEPTDSGESPLAAIGEWVNTICPTCGKPAKRETDTMPNWAGSSWYYLRYFDAHNELAFADQKKLEYWGAVDMYLGGMEHTTLHLLYSRFWHQFFYDQGLVPTPEPYTARRGQGIILATDGSKMSKSKGNVINPSEIIEQGYGADALRMAIAFLAPFDQTTPWSPESVAGTFRFIQRTWTLIQEFLVASKNSEEDAELTKLVNKTTKKVSQDLHAMGFNTAISALMELVNELYKKKALDGFARYAAWEKSIASLVQLLAPFAPHVAEELWQQLGNSESVHTSTWPTWDESLIVDDTITIVVQVNGKLRGEIQLPSDASQADVLSAAKGNQAVAAHLDTKEIVREVYVPGRLVNFVVS